MCSYSNVSAPVKFAYIHMDADDNLPLNTLPNFFERVQLMSSVDYVTGFQVISTPDAPLDAISDTAIYMVDQSAPSMKWGNRIDVQYAISVLVPFFDTSIHEASYVKEWHRVLQLAGCTDIDSGSANSQAVQPIQGYLGKGDQLVLLELDIDPSTHTLHAIIFKQA